MDSFVDRTKEELARRVAKLYAEIEEMQPNSRANEQLEATKGRLETTSIELKAAKDASRQAAKQFAEIKKKRLETFMSMFNHVRDTIGEVYKDMTKSVKHMVGGQASLLLEDDNDEPYLSGIKYNTLVPGKRFRDMDQLSGGEKVRSCKCLCFIFLVKFFSSQVLWFEFGAHTFSDSYFFLLSSFFFLLSSFFFFFSSLSYYLPF